MMTNMLMNVLKILRNEYNIYDIYPYFFDKVVGDNYIVRGVTLNFDQGSPHTWTTSNFSNLMEVIKKANASEYIRPDQLKIPAQTSHELFLVLAPKDNYISWLKVMISGHISTQLINECGGSEKFRKMTDQEYLRDREHEIASLFMLEHNLYDLVNINQVTIR